MPNYRRQYLENRPVFVTVVTKERKPWLANRHGILLDAMREARKLYPLQHLAHVILPDHFHWLFLPQEPERLGKLMACVKRGATWRCRNINMTGVLWQNRFYDHVIRNEADYRRHLDYIHFNPVKHKYTDDPASYTLSSFKSWQQRGFYPVGWGKTEPDHLKDLILE